MNTDKMAKELIQMAKVIKAASDVSFGCEGTSRGYTLTINVRVGSGSVAEDREIKDAVSKADKIKKDQMRDLKKIKGLNVKEGQALFVIDRNELYRSVDIELIFRDNTITNEVIDVTHELGYQCPL